MIDRCQSLGFDVIIYFFHAQHFKSGTAASERQQSMGLRESTQNILLLAVVKTELFKKIIRNAFDHTLDGLIIYIIPY